MEPHQLGHTLAAFATALIVALGLPETEQEAARARLAAELKNFVMSSEETPQGEALRHASKALLAEGDDTPSAKPST